MVYQIYPRSFADSDGDGIGDLRGVIGKLDYLAALGVDAVWLSPVYRSPHDDNGYDISDYEDVDPLFGSGADLDELIAGLHARDIKLVMDLVVNHTSDEHPWFLESRSSVDNPKRDWYWWRQARPGREPGTSGAEPTNWRSFFSGPAWEYDAVTGEYYLHLFSRKQPELNWENAAVRQAVFAMMNRWVARGVDGFRMDVITLISKQVGPDGSLPDGVAGADGLGDPRPFVLNGPRIHELLREMHREVLEGRGLMTVAEAPGSTVADARLYSDAGRREVNMVFTFEHVDLDTVPGGIKWDLAPLRLPDLKANLAAWQEGLSDVGWNSLYCNNHDQPRSVSRWGDDADYRVESAKSLATVLHLMRGTPYVYQGEELGMTNAHFSSLDSYRDIESISWAADAARRGIGAEVILRALAAKSRDNARTPMQWDGTPNAGFTTGTPWLDVNPNHDAINAEAALADPASVFHHYRRLIALRHTEPVHGDFRLLLGAHDQVFAYVRALGTTRLLVVANLSGRDVTVDLDADGRLLHGALMVGTHAAAPSVSGTSITLEPWESRVMLTR